jgi:hypothetical protein
MTAQSATAAQIVADVTTGTSAIHRTRAPRPTTPCAAGRLLFPARPL